MHITSQKIHSHCGQYLVEAVLACDGPGIVTPIIFYVRVSTVAQQEQRARLMLVLASQVEGCHVLAVFVVDVGLGLRSCGHTTEMHNRTGM